MNELTKNSRRKFFGRMGRGLLGLFGGGVLAGAASRSANAGVFAGTFLNEREPLELPPGYYDDQTQLFRVTSTGEAMFVEEQPPSGTPLTPEELSDLLDSGTFVDISKFPKMKVATNTQCTQTTLSTTTCCPIVTDREPESVPDD